MTNWIKSVTDTLLPLAKIDILFGVPLYENVMQCLNFIILHGKWHIYKSKLKNEEPFLLDYLVELKNEINIERYISIIHGEIHKFDEIWGTFHDVLF